MFTFIAIILVLGLLGVFTLPPIIGGISTWIIILVAVLIFGGGGYYWFGRNRGSRY